jgi:hypothetical protein
MGRKKYVQFVVRLQLFTVATGATRNSVCGQLAAQSVRVRGKHNLWGRRPRLAQLPKLSPRAVGWKVMCSWGKIKFKSVVRARATFECECESCTHADVIGHELGLFEQPWDGFNVRASSFELAVEN